MTLNLIFSDIGHVEKMLIRHFEPSKATTKAKKVIYGLQSRCVHIRLFLFLLGCSDKVGTNNNSLVFPESSVDPVDSYYTVAPPATPPILETCSPLQRRLREKTQFLSLSMSRHSLPTLNPEDMEVNEEKTKILLTFKISSAKYKKTLYFIAARCKTLHS